MVIMNTDVNYRSGSIGGGNYHLYFATLGFLLSFKNTCGFYFLKESVTSPNGYSVGQAWVLVLQWVDPRRLCGCSARLPSDLIAPMQAVGSNLPTSTCTPAWGISLAEGNPWPAKTSKDWEPQEAALANDRWELMENYFLILTPVLSQRSGCLCGITYMKRQEGVSCGSGNDRS